MIRSPAALASLMLGTTLLASTPRLAAASGSYQDAVAGAEVYATTTNGKFVGTATGALLGAWYASIVHGSLSSGAAPITGGSFYLGARLGGQPALLEGGFVGGSVTQTGGFTGCANQTYAVRGRLGNVGRYGNAQTGSGAFVATLTHHRSRILGSCVTYSATVAGTVSLTF